MGGSAGEGSSAGEVGTSCLRSGKPNLKGGIDNVTPRDSSSQSSSIAAEPFFTVAAFNRRCRSDERWGIMTLAVVFMGGLLVSLVLVLMLDQTTKALVLAHLGESQAVGLGRLTIRKLINGRVAPFLSAPGQLLTLWAAEVVVILALVHVGMFKDATAQAAVGAALGGAGGNVCDRLWRGGVVDFIDVGFWPVFNVGDAAIVLGASMALIFLLGQ